jgi:hypothetical protein
MLAIVVPSACLWWYTTTGILNRLPDCGVMTGGDVEKPVTVKGSASSLLGCLFMTGGVVEGPATVKGTSARLGWSSQEIAIAGVVTCQNSSEAWSDVVAAGTVVSSSPPLYAKSSVRSCPMQRSQRSLSHPRETLPLTWQPHVWRYI